MLLQFSVFPPLRKSPLEVSDGPPRNTDPPSCGHEPEGVG